MASRPAGEFRLDPASVRVGAQPIIWSNDDFSELGGETSLDQCLSEMKAAGYAGTELGHKFPSDAAALRNVLERHGLKLVSGWHSAYLASRPFEDEKEEFLRHLNLLVELGSRVVIIAECTGRTYHRPAAAMGRGSCASVLDRDGWVKVLGGLEILGRLAQDKGVQLVYHPHMGTVVEGRGEIDRLMDSTRSVALLADTGHLAFAGVKPLDVIRVYRLRVAHVHLKNVRPEVVRQAVLARISFKDAVKRGVFTVPGDGTLPRGGGIDFGPIFASLAEARYGGWLVVEAEQDPVKAPPLEYARRAREYIRRAAGL